MPKIMLVEDDNNLREIYGERLMAEGYDIVSASDGEEALALAVKEKPDLIISDVMMPKISGFDMLDILRQTPETKNTKVIMMTALSQSEDKDRADRLGADKYLVKSQVTLEDVARVVHDLINPPADTSDEPDVNDSNTTETVEPTATSPAEQTIDDQTLNQPAVEVVVEPAINVAPEPSNVDTVVVPQNPVQQAPVPEPVASEPISAPVITPAPVVPEPVQQPAVEPTSVPVVAPIPQPVTPSAAATPVVTNSVPSQAPVPEPVAQPVVQPYQPTPTSAPAIPPPPIAPTSQPTQPASQPTPVNPITGEPTTTAEISAPTTASTADAQTTNDELAEIEKQLADFTSSPNTEEIAKHQAPLVEPSEQELIHAQNATEEPEVIQTFDQQSAPAQNSTQNSDHTVPTITPPVASDNLEPASARKKVINPINGAAPSGPNIYELYEKEMAKEAADSAVLNPSAGNEVLATSADTNPITTSTDIEAPALETVNISEIDGIAVDEEKPAPAPQPTVTQQPLQVTPEPSLDPNDPNSIAL